MNGQLLACSCLHAELSKMQRAFPDQLAMFKVILTTPVASASAERSFSTVMRRVKSHLRASMSAARTSDLNLSTVERQLSGALFDDPESAIEIFASMGPCRITLKWKHCAGLRAVRDSVPFFLTKIVLNCWICLFILYWPLGLRYNTLRIVTVSSNCRLVFWWYCMTLQRSAGCYPNQ